MSDLPPGEAQEFYPASGAAAVTVPLRLVRLVRRLLGLRPGRYVIVLSIHGDEHGASLPRSYDWTIQEGGQIEK